MYSNSKHCHLLQWAGLIVIHPTAISAYGLLRRGPLTSESQMQTLCFDLSKLEHGQFGSRTVQASKANAPWLLDFDEVTEGLCKGIEEEELLTDQQMKEVTYCKHFGTSIDIIEYQLDAPRYFERFLYDIGAARGECMTADAELDSDDSMDSMVSLCIDLGGYGPQTVVVDKQASPWFFSNDSRVTKGECKRTGQKLDRREAELVTYCKQFGSPSDGYEYGIEAPEFLSDYLYTSKGAQRGECPSLEAGLVLCHVPEDLTIKADVISRRDLRKKKRGRTENNCNCSVCGEKKTGPSNVMTVGLPEPEKNQNNKSSNKDKPKIGKPKIGKNPNKNRRPPKTSQNDWQQTAWVQEQSQQERWKSSNKDKPKIGKPKIGKNPNKNRRPPKTSQNDWQQTAWVQEQSQQEQWKSSNKDKPKIGKPKIGKNQNKNNTPKPNPNKNKQQQQQWQPQGQQPPQNDWQVTTTTWDQQPNTSWQQPQASWRFDTSTSTDCICRNVPAMGFAHKPGTNCREYVQCNNGNIMHNSLSCGNSGLIFDNNLQICQWPSLGAVCRPDPQGC